MGPTSSGIMDVLKQHIPELLFVNFDNRVMYDNETSMQALYKEDKPSEAMLQSMDAQQAVLLFLSTVSNATMGESEINRCWIPCQPVHATRDHARHALFIEHQGHGC